MHYIICDLLLAIGLIFRIFFPLLFIGFIISGIEARLNVSIRADKANQQSCGKAKEESQVSDTKGVQVESQAEDCTLSCLVDEFVLGLAYISAELGDMRLKEDLEKIIELCRTEPITKEFTKFYDNGLGTLYDVLQKYSARRQHSSKLADHLHELNNKVINKLTESYNSYRELDLLTAIENASKTIDLHL